MFEDFTYTNLHQLNLDWLVDVIEKLHDNMVISVNGQTGEVVLYKDATVQLPNVDDRSWTILRNAHGVKRGIKFDQDGIAYIVSGNSLAAVFTPENPPANSQITYDQYVRLTTLTDEQMHNWNIFRTLNNQSIGIEFDDTGDAYIISGSNRYKLYSTKNPISGDVSSVNGQTGDVVLYTDSNGEMTMPGVTNPNVDAWSFGRSVNGTDCRIYIYDDGQVVITAGNNEYRLVNSDELSDLEDEVTDLKSAFDDITVPGFNLFDKNAIIEGKTYSGNSGALATNTSRYSTPKIDVRNCGHGRVRCNILPKLLIVFDANGDPISQGSSYIVEGRYAIDISSASFVALSFANTQSPDTVMLAYTDETSGASSDKWNELFPNIGYVPYVKNINIEYVYDKDTGETLPTILSAIEKREEEKRIIDRGYSADDFVNALSAVSGVGVSTDTYTNETVLTFNGASGSSTKLWTTLQVPCLPSTNYVLEFYGKANNITNNGGFFIVYFNDKDGNRIGEYQDKYNAYVLSLTRRAYHKYGYTSPVGATSVSLLFYTRAGTTMELSGITFKKVAPSMLSNSGNGVRIMGHQGMIYSAPKNTMPSFELGKIAGFREMVVNVNVSADGTLYCLHDNTIDATSNGTGNISSYTDTQLAGFDFGSWFNAVYTGTKIPTFESVISFLVMSGIRPVISLHHNLNSTQLANMCSILKNRTNGRCSVKSWYLSELETVYSNLGDNAEYIYIVDQPTTADVDNLIAFSASNKMFELKYTEISDASISNYCHAHGLPVSVYFGNDTRMVKPWIADGIVNCITVDTYPDINIPFD